MTSQTRATNIALFENGDVPSGTNYRDLIDSYVGLIDATAQTMTSNLAAPTLIATVVCAGTLYADTMIVGGFIGVVSADNGLVVSGAAKFNSTISVKQNMAVSGAATFFNGVRVLTGDLSAAATFTDTLTVNGATQLNGTTSAAGLFADSLTVSGTTKLSGMVSADSGISVSGVGRFATVCANAIFTDSFIPQLAHGHMHIVSAGVVTATNCSSAGTFIKAKAVTTAQTLIDVSATNNRLTYIGIENKTFLVTINAGCSSGSTNVQLGVGVGLNGSLLVGSDIHHFVGTGNNMAAMGTTYVVILSTDDFVELFVTSNAGSQNTVHNMSFAMLQI